MEEKLTVKLPISNLLFELTDLGLYFNGRLLDSSITEWLPSTLLITPEYFEILANRGCYIRVTEKGIRVLKRIRDCEEI